MENVTLSQRWGVSCGVAGRDYLMAVLTTGNPSEQYGVSTIDTLGALVWRGMS
jgi:hypothetical protein